MGKRMLPDEGVTLVKRYTESASENLNSEKQKRVLLEIMEIFRSNERVMTAYFKGKLESEGFKKLLYMKKEGFEVMEDTVKASKTVMIWFISGKY